MLGAAGGVFRLVVVELGRRHDIDDIERPVAQDGAGQFLAGDVALDQNLVRRMPNRRDRAPAADADAPR